MKIIRLILFVAVIAPGFVRAEDTGVTVSGTSEETIYLLNIDVSHRSIHDVLRGIAEAASLNIVLPEYLEGHVSLRLRNVTWRQSFDVMLQPIGYTYRIQENVIKIVPIERPEPEAPDPGAAAVGAQNAWFMAGVAAALSVVAVLCSGGTLLFLIFGRGK